MSSCKEFQIEILRCEYLCDMLFLVLLYINIFPTPFFLSFFSCCAVLNYIFRFWGVSCRNIHLCLKAGLTLTMKQVIITSIQAREESKPGESSDIFT